MIIPTGHEFSPLDEVLPPLYNAIIYGYACEESDRERILKVIQDGYSRVLRLCPYLGADIVRDESPANRPGSLKLNIPEPAEDIKVEVKDLTSPESGWKHTYTELREAGMPQSWLDPALLAPYVAGTASTTKVLTAQVNWIPGGCLFTMCIAHALADAWGSAMVVHFWAQQCRELQNLPQSNGQLAKEFNGHCPALHEISGSQEDFDRLKSRKELWKLLGLHWEENLIPPANAISLPTTIPAASMAIPGMRSCIFSFSPSASARLKADATLANGKGWISTKDAFAALLWRSVMRARFPHASKSTPSASGTNHDESQPSDQTSIVSVAIDGRPLYTPKVPYSYIGNVIFCCMTEAPLSSILSTNSSHNALATLANSIRASIEAVKSDPSLVADATLLAASIPDVCQPAIAFKDFLSRDLITTSWIDIPFYEADFGPALGKPEFVRIPRGQFGGICILQPRKQNGEIEVLISLKGDDMERFLKDEEFVKYATFVCE